MALTEYIKNHGRDGKVKSDIFHSIAPKERLYAALDLGTNSCRMLIARPQAEGFEVLDSFSKVVHLGKGLVRTGAIHQEAMLRALSALKICEQKLSFNDVHHVRLVATEACRQARNGKGFLKRVSSLTGLNLEIITPQEEARLAVIGSAHHLRLETNQVMVVDIGGGSTEMVWIDLRDVEPKHRKQSVIDLDLGSKTRKAHNPLGAKVVDWISVPLGVSTLLAQFKDVAHDWDQFALMSCFFEDQLEEFSPSHRAADRMCPTGFQIIGTSGTLTTIAASHLGLDRYQRSEVDGIVMSAQDVDVVVSRYLRLGVQGRRNDPCIGPARQSLILSGAAILQGILRVWPTDHLTVADCGLREGLLYSQMHEQGVWDFDI